MFKNYIQQAKWIKNAIKAYIRDKDSINAIGLKPYLVSENEVQLNTDFVNKECKLKVLDDFTPMAIVVKVMGDPLGYRIFINDAFSKQDQRFKSAVLAHERGHYYTNTINNIGSLQDEIKCDNYSSNLGNDILHFLVTLIECNSIYLLQSDIISRIENTLTNYPELSKQHTKDKALLFIKSYKLGVKLKLFA